MHSEERQPDAENRKTAGEGPDLGGQPVAPPGDAAGLPTELLEIRHSIDNIDAAMVYLLAERFKCTQRVGVLKAQYSLPPADPERETAQIARLRALASSADLDPALAEKYLAFVVEEVIRHHKAIAAGGDRKATEE